MGNKEKNFNEMDLNQLTDLNIDNLNISELESLLGQFESMVTDSFNETINESLNSKNDLKFVINFVNKSNNSDPEYATTGSSGFDLRSNEDNVLNSGEFKLISTGLYFDIPENMEIQVRSRSGLAAKNGVCVLNSPGTVTKNINKTITF